jgi:Uma2 family endonuclease
MSTITRQPRVSPAAPMPSPATPPIASVYRMDVDEFERIADFLKAERIELIDGLLVERGAMDPPHAVASERLGRRLDRVIPDGWFVRENKPLRVHRTYEPIPDFAVVRGDPDTAYEDRHPGPADVALVIEISDSTLSKDRGEKRVNYAKGRIGAYWIVNLIDRQVEVYTVKVRGGYGKPHIFKPGESVPVVIDGVEVGQIVVSEILPRDPLGSSPSAGGHPAQARVPRPPAGGSRA